MSRHVYAVEVHGIGTVQVSRDRIADARAWAATAFGRDATSVRPVYAQRSACRACDSRPCCCPAHGDTVSCPKHGRKELREDGDTYFCPECEPPAHVEGA